MKDKKIILIAAAVIAVVVIGYVLFMRPGSTNLLTGSQADIIESAFSGNGSVTCEFTDEEGVVTTAYVQNGMVRTNMSGGPNNVMASMISKDNTIWTWDENTMEGMMMEIPEVTPGMTEEVETEMDYDPSEVKQSLEQYRESCQTGAVDSSLFEVPTDVSFNNMSDMMEGMPNMPQIPAGYEQYMPQ